MVRAPYFDKNGVKKGAWSQEEDEMLRAYIEKHGHYNWRELPKLAGLSRCGKSCRLRWVNYLCPDIRHGDFSREEEDLILQLHAEIGNKWSTIAARLQGRTDNEIKNYWHSHLKKRAKQYESKLESKGQSSCEASQNETSQNIRDLEAQSIVVPSQPIILESSPLSPESYSLNSEAAQVPESGTKWITENSPTLVHKEEYSSSADFWTAPFVPDNYAHEQDGYQPSFSLDEGGFASAYASLYDDTIDLFYQAMQELPGSSPNSS